VHPPLVYREGSLADREQVKALGLLSYGQFSEILGEEGWTKMKNGISDDDRWIGLLRDSKSFICLANDKIVGMAFIVPSGNPWQVFEAGWSYIRMVGVDPEFRGKGIAKELTRRCIEHAKTSGEKIIALHTSEFMDTARHIYESLGFKVLREIDPLFGKRYWLYLLEL
jgi:ribosomal protein S18 acetylase RimI-like enzyme